MNMTARFYITAFYFYDVTMQVYVVTCLIFNTIEDSVDSFHDDNDLRFGMLAIFFIDIIKFNSKPVLRT